MRRRKPSSSASRRIAAAMSRTACSGVPAAILKPVSGVTWTAGPPRSRQTTGLPAAIASRQTQPPESCRLGWTSAVDVEQAVQCLLAGEPAEEGDAIGNAERAGQGRQARPLRPVPDDPVLGVREIRCRERAQPQVEALPVKQVTDADEAKCRRDDPRWGHGVGRSPARPRPTCERTRTVPAPTRFSLFAVSAVVASARQLRRAVRRTNGSSSPKQRASSRRRS